MEATAFKAHRIIPLLNRLLNWYPLVAVKGKPTLNFYLEKMTISVYSNTTPMANLVWESADQDAQLVFQAGSRLPFEDRQFVAAFIHQVLSSLFQRVDVIVDWADPGISAA